MKTQAGPTALALLLLAGCAKPEDPSIVRLTGRLEAPTVDLAAKVAGRVVEVLVKEGDRVKAGAVLLKLDLGETSLGVSRDRASLGAAEARLKDLETGSRKVEIQAAEADVAEKRAALELARKELGRQASLLARKVGIPRDHDRAKSDVERAEATLHVSQERLALVREGARDWQKEGARRDVDRAEVLVKQSESVARESEILAPADGAILHRLAEPGLLLGAGQAGLTMAFTDRLYVRTFIPEGKLGRIKPGQDAEVTVDAYPGRVFKARVAEISPDAEFTPKAVETRAERVNLVFGAKIDLEGGWSEPLVPGQPADVVLRVR